jgi:hypothetical protein
MVSWRSKWPVFLSVSPHDEIRNIREIGGERREQRGLRWAGFDLEVQGSYRRNAFWISSLISLPVVIVTLALPLRSYRGQTVFGVTLNSFILHCQQVLHKTHSLLNEPERFHLPASGECVSSARARIHCLNKCSPGGLLGSGRDNGPQEIQCETCGPWHNKTGITSENQEYSNILRDPTSAPRQPAAVRSGPATARWPCTHS